MDKDYFINSGIPPPQPLHFESSMPIQWSSDQSNFVNPNSTIDQFSRFDSNWSSIAPSAATAAAAEAFAFRELIGKLGGGLSGNANDCSNLPSTAALASPAGSADPRFADRAAKFSSFGSRSFNGRAPQLGPSNAGSNLQRVSSTPSLKRNGSPPAVNGGASSNEESSVSQEIPTGERVSFNSRKRKAISRGKTKAAGDENSKRWKPTKKGENETKAEEEFKEGSNDEDDKNKTNQKPPEPPKDYIHVRARRGQATDSHSLAERVRREKISERMKLLEDLVPGCNKVTGKALMLDEIINYVQSLQRQVEFLSMKLSSVNPSLDFNVENLLSKDILPQQMHHLDSSLPPFYHHQNVQQQKLHGTNISRTHPLDANMDGFSEYLPQFPAFTEDDLHSIFQMGFVQSSVNFPVQNQASDMKVEL